jgi:hypothetical protein
MTAKRKDFELGRGEYNTNAADNSIAIHKFGSTDDALAVIVVSAYFNDIFASEIAVNSIRKGDMIAVTDSAQDAQLYKITAVTPNVTIATL